MNQEIWTSDVRRVLYGLLKRRFGPLSEWESNSPGRNLESKYDAFCEEFAKVVGAKSGDAVKIQIRFAMPESANGSTWGQGQARTAILNKAAALEVGFIDNHHLPSVVHSARGPFDLEDLA